MSIVSPVTISVGAGEDREWTFSVVGFNLTNHVLKCLMSKDGVTNPSWELSATVQSSSTFLLAITASQSSVFPSGDYTSDIRAEDTTTGKRRFIVPQMIVSINEQVTKT